MKMDREQYIFELKEIIKDVNSKKLRYTQYCERIRLLQKEYMKDAKFLGNFD